MYVQRWLKAAVKLENGTVKPREIGMSQGDVISPLLANLFLHYAFDKWMQREHLQVPFARYADDVIVHCNSERQAKEVMARIGGRLAECGLTLHPTKTTIVYCKDGNRK